MIKKSWKVSSMHSLLTSRQVHPTFCLPTVITTRQALSSHMFYLMFLIQSTGDTHLVHCANDWHMNKILLWTSHLHAFHTHYRRQQDTVFRSSSNKLRAVKHLFSSHCIHTESSKCSSFYFSNIFVRPALRTLVSLHTHTSLTWHRILCWDPG